MAASDCDVTCYAVAVATHLGITDRASRLGTSATFLGDHRTLGALFPTQFGQSGQLPHLVKEDGYRGRDCVVAAPRSQI